MNTKLKRLMNVLAEVFNPLVPAFIVAGLSMGVGNLLFQCVQNLEQKPLVFLLYNILNVINRSFTPFLTVWVGALAAKTFGATTILGGMIGMVTVLPEIDTISSMLGAEKFLYMGAGGVIAAFLGAFFLSKLEAFFKKRMPKALDTVLTPLLSFLIVIIPYILLIMPIAGLISYFLSTVIDAISFSDSIIVNIIVGFLGASMFLPINVAGLQHGIIAMYPLQLDKYGYIVMYPVFAMAGAGQVGSGLAVAYLAKKCGNNQVATVAISSSIPGTMGVATPLIYSVSLPIPKAFLSACIASGMGGIFIKLFSVYSTGWGPSGLLALFMMNGPKGPIFSMAIYLLGLLISMILGLVFTLLVLKKEELEEI